MQRKFERTSLEPAVGKEEKRCIRASVANEEGGILFFEKEGEIPFLL